jgi:hypothetical protein
MLYISHRGNLEGPIAALENTQDYIVAAIQRGFLVEIDLWGEIDGEHRTLWLGHDRPERPVSSRFIHRYNSNLIYHCKNAAAYTLLQTMVTNPIMFFHDRDDYVFTSNGWVWCYPGKIPPGQDGIIVMPERVMDLEKVPDYCTQHSVSGICSDYIRVLRISSEV